MTLTSYGTSGNEIVRFQNSIQSIFNRVRLLYGATPLEDMINYNVIVRNLTEWTGTTQNGTMDQTSIAEGVGGVVVGFSNTNGTGTSASGLLNVRQDYIQGYDNTITTNGVAGFGMVPNGNAGNSGVTGYSHYSTRRYQVNFALGLFTQDKLIPTKWMASQLAIELTLEQPQACIFSCAASNSTATPTYIVSSVNLIPEILEFDSSYDETFAQGLSSGGVPIKFCSWRTFPFVTGGAATVNLLVQERSRSVKALFCVQRRAPSVMTTDSHACFFDTSVTNGSNTGAGTGGTLQNYQWRIGGRYFPSQAVQCSTTVGSDVTNGAAEAYIELAKALNIVGDYRLASSVNATRWGLPPATAAITVVGNATQSNLSEFDYCTAITSFNSNGAPVITPITAANATTGVPFSGNLGSACFAAAIDLETSNGLEISGLNAEEQSDIAFIANWGTPQASGFLLEVYSFYDAMIVLRANNVLELIQ